MTAATTGEGTTSVPSPGDSDLHEQFQQQHPGMTESHELYAELFEDWVAEGGR